MKKPISLAYVLVCYFAIACAIYWVWVYRNRRNYVTSARFLDAEMCRPHRDRSRDYGGRTCVTRCTTGAPCEYPDELDLRIIVITFNRPQSLAECLKHVAEMDTCGDRVGVDIWIDRKTSGKVNKKVLKIATNFSKSWSNGQACVHVQDTTAQVTGQWIDSWRPKPNTSEMALILEDDIDISPLAYRWLRTVKSHFKFSKDVAGCGLQMENVRRVQGRRWSLHGPETDVVFLYRQMPTWGYAPEPTFWRRFQDWYHLKREDPTFHPYIPNIISTQWYRDLERKNKQDSMWSMWLKYYCHVNGMYSLYPNLVAYTGRADVLMDTNRREPGLHYGRAGRLDNDHLLLRHWYTSFERFPHKVAKYSYDGSRVD